MFDEFNGPISGQSLTAEPGAAAWERPPQMDDPEEAALYHLDRLSEPKRVTALLDSLELGLSIVDLTKGILRFSVSEGIHSIDVSMLIAPIIHEHIKTVAEVSKIDYEEGLPEEQDRSDINYSINSRKASKMFENLKEEMNVPTEEVEVEEEVIVDEVPEERPMGLMSPRGEV